ncbi:MULTISPECIES: ChaB family protein [Streptomyces]|uniref:Cation transport regulator ChaB n=2 Tax=Streptomyces TaxID=1883 RepID=A0A100Y214_9ACTN|nr:MULTISPECIES: ChaB family protein [Streptomyces]KUH36204.1 cation transport regulator ChaB [Streptomyces kanasensis]UUS33582.1 ChaB family protein [Streptomyces changanensis]
MPGREELPSTLERSPEGAQRTWIAAHDSAVEQYGEGERAHRVAFSALKHAYEKVGDHWEEKEKGRKGPSDPRAEAPRDRPARSGEGVDENASKRHLYELARRLGVEGRSRMSKTELAEALRRENRTRTRQAREH